MSRDDRSGLDRASSSTERSDDSGPVQATFGRRLGAVFIDNLVIWTLVFVIGNIAYPTNYFYDSRITGMLFAGGLVALLIYNWLFTAFRGQTPGKKLLKIKVVNVRGRRPSLIRSLWRESAGRVVMTVSIFVEGVFLIISNMSAYTLSNTTLISYPERGYRKPTDRDPVNILDFYDRFTGTKVVKTRRR